MQLGPPSNLTPLRKKLGRTALALALLDIPAAAHADTGPVTQLDLTTLLYGEESRTRIFEPLVQATRLFPDGQSFSGQFGLDVITGASPSGALPSGGTQTTTTPSGNVVTSGAGQIPMTQFSDQRFGLDGDWHKPLGRLFSSTIGGHFSRERDYQSLGINGKLSVDIFRRLTTLTIGGGANHDSVFPHGGTPAGLSDGAIVSTQGNPKQVRNILLGVSQVLTRRWLASMDVQRTYESGYLTEPYKVISVVDAVTGVPLSQLTDKRPSTHDRTSLFFNSAFHFSNDILYVSYRYYWDDWNINSNTIDLKYRHDLTDRSYLQPHFRYYSQTAASFYTIGLVEGAPLPDFATADNRLGPLKTITFGTTYGFHLGDSPAEWNVRAEYIRQTGDSHPADAIGIQKGFDLSPPINTFAVLFGYSFNL